MVEQAINTFKTGDSPVKAGDLILAEEPFAYTLSSKENGSRCDHCLQKCKVQKCSGCQFVYYCGKSCQRDAWMDHRWECANLKRIAPKIIPDGARMLAKIINRLKRGDGNSYKVFYSRTSFRMWKDLMSHYSDLKKDKKRMEHFTSLCVVLYEFLNDVSLPNIVDVMGLYGRMIINSFNILDINMNSIGTGIYIVASIVDHSCDPNAVAIFNGRTIIIRAIKDMPKLDWQQLRISYIDLMKTPFERQMELLQNYYFLCQCDRCLDTEQLKYLHAAKCLNKNCDNPVAIKWKENCTLVKIEKPENRKRAENIQNGGPGDESFKNSNDNGKNEDSKYNKKCVAHGENSNANGKNINAQNGDNVASENIAISVSNSKIDDKNVVCSKCATKYTDEQIEAFIDAMEYSEVHLLDMKSAPVAYIETCKFCLEKQEGVLHPLNVFHAQMLDQALEAYVHVELWQQACVYAEQLIPCFRFYYGSFHPLLGLLHLKYGKILLYKMDLSKAVEQLKSAAKILKITHGEAHPLYTEQLLPLLHQAVVEFS